MEMATPFKKEKKTVQGKNYKYGPTDDLQGEEGDDNVDLNRKEKTNFSE